MGDLAPPLRCPLVTSSTGESPSPSPRSKKAHSRVETEAKDDVTSSDVNCCDVTSTTLTEEDDNDSFIKVEHGKKKSKNKDKVEGVQYTKVSSGNISLSEEKKPSTHWGHYYKAKSHHKPPQPSTSQPPLPPHPTGSYPSFQSFPPPKPDLPLSSMLSVPPPPIHGSVASGGPWPPLHGRGIKSAAFPTSLPAGGVVTLPPPHRQAALELPDVIEPSPLPSPTPDGTESECGSVSNFSIPESIASSSSSYHDEQPGKLFVGSLAASVTEQDLYKYFSQFGEVKSCFIKFDLGSNKSRGFGFVVFRDAEVINAVMGYNGSEANPPVNSNGVPQTRAHVIHGRPIHVRKAKPIAEMKRIRLKDDFDETQHKRVFIGGVPLEVTEEVIQSHFSKVGPVEKVILIFGTSENENGRHRGIGFVTFAQRQHAEAAIRIRYHVIPEHFCTIECKPAIQKGEKISGESTTSTPSSNLNLTLADFQSEMANASKLPPPPTTSTMPQMALKSSSGLLPTPALFPPGLGLPTVPPPSGLAPQCLPVIEVTPAAMTQPPPGVSQSAPSLWTDSLNTPNDLRPLSTLSAESGYGSRAVSPTNLESSEASWSNSEGNNNPFLWSDKGEGVSRWLMGETGQADTGNSHGLDNFIDESLLETLRQLGISTESQNDRNPWGSSGAFDCFNSSQFQSGQDLNEICVGNGEVPKWKVESKFGTEDSRLGLNPYGTSLSFTPHDQMARILDEKFPSSEKSKSLYGPNNAGTKYEWNHWNNGDNKDSFHADEDHFLLDLKNLPFAPFSRLTFLKDDPMENRGLNGSNGFDVYVK